MGKLQNLRVYLSGPIEGASDFGYGWREDIKPFLRNLGVLVIDPLEKPIDLGLEEGKNIHAKINSLIEEENYDEVARIFRLIRRTDLRMCDVCDFMIAYLDNTVQACGTFEEIFNANRSKKAVLVVCPQGKKNVSRWLYGTLPHQFFFNNFDELKEYLLGVDSEEDERDFDRWQFFDYSQLS